MGKKVIFIIFRSTPPTEVFVSKKLRYAETHGFEAEIVRKEVLNTEEAIEVIRETSATHPDGIVVQLPLPVGLDVDAILDAVPPELDLDILGTQTKQKFVRGDTQRFPPVAYAARELFIRNNISLEGKEIVVLGKGRLVGEPVRLWLEREGVKFAIFDKDASEEERQRAVASAGIIITGIGVPHYLKPDMVKTGAVIIDAGTSEQAGKLAGDADPACAEKAGYLSPVPGGVGPLTIEGLFKNLALD